MDTIIRTVTVLAMLSVQVAFAERIPNPSIDYVGFSSTVSDVHALRESRRISEAQFIEMSRQPDTVVLDARSAEKFATLHVAGAVHLNFSDITSDTLADLIPSKSTRILIYCNNNFVNAPEPFPAKIAVAALNIPTFVTLHAYGYENVYELGPVVDPKTSKIRFEGALTRRN